MGQIFADGAVIVAPTEAPNSVRRAIEKSEHIVPGLAVRSPAKKSHRIA